MDEEIKKKIEIIEERYDIELDDKAIEAWAVHVDKRVEDWKGFNGAFKDISGKYGSRRGKGWPGFIFMEDPAEKLASSEKLMKYKEDLGLEYFIFKVWLLPLSNRVDKSDWSYFMKDCRALLQGKHTWAAGGDAGAIVIPMDMKDPQYVSMRDAKKNKYNRWKKSEEKKKKKINIECPVCGEKYDIEIPDILIEDKQVKGVMEIKLKLSCGHECKVVFDQDMKVTKIKKVEKKGQIDFDVDAFLEGNEEIGVLFPSMEEVDLLGRPKLKLSKSLSELVPTKPEMKTADQIKADDEKIERDLKTEIGLIKARVVEFEKILGTRNKIKMAECCKLLKDIKSREVIKFIRILDNDMILRFNANKDEIIINNPTDQEVEVLGSLFERHLRFHDLE
ncbi:MAG: hypothetical protein ACTSUE_20245 [Promethearchaeota archaeon]